MAIHTHIKTKSELDRLYHRQLTQYVKNLYPQWNAKPLINQPPTTLQRVWQGFVGYIDFMSVLKKNAFIKKVYTLTLNYHRDLHELELASPSQGISEQAAMGANFKMVQLARKYNGIVLGKMNIPLNKANQQFADQLTLAFIQRTIEQTKRSLITYDLNDHIENISRLIQQLMKLDKMTRPPASLTLPSETVPIDSSFAQHIVDAASSVDQRALIIQLDGHRDGHHSLGIVDDNDGIWFIDTNQYAVRIPRYQFVAFFNQYIAENYADYQQADIHLIGQKPQVKAARTDQRQRTVTFSKPVEQRIDTPSSTPEDETPSRKPKPKR